MSGPDFGDVEGDDGKETESNSRKSPSDGSKHVHIKGVYGTETFQASDGCYVCGRNADVVVEIDRMGDGGPTLAQVNHPACDSHKGEIIGDQVDEGFTYTVHEF